MTYFEIARALEQEGEAFVSVTQIAQRGETPADLGAKAVVTEAGLRWGTIGGGKIEARAIEFAQQKLIRDRLNPSPEVIQWNLQRDIGMTCGGEVTFLFELHSMASWKIAVFGAGHVAQALVRALEPLACQVMCVDSREEWIGRLPKTVRLKAQVLSEPSLLVSELDAATFFVVMTQGHATDVPILAQILKTHPDAPYVGVIGSDIKAMKIKAELRGLGFSEHQVSRIRIPIGLPIGSNDPAEIAISIVAQLLEVRGTRESRF